MTIELNDSEVELLTILYNILIFYLIFRIFISLK